MTHFGISMYDVFYCRAVLAIGETCVSGESMYESAMRGKGVAIRHYYGDHLW